MKIILTFAFILTAATACITPQKASEKCSGWAEKWPRYFKRDTVIQITRPGLKKTQIFQATPDTNIIYWGNSSFIYRTAPGTPPECDTVKIESIYRTKPDTITQKVEVVKYRDRKKEKGRPWRNYLIAGLLGALSALIITHLLTKKL